MALKACSNSAASMPHGSGDRLEVYGDPGTMTYDFGSDMIQGGQVGDGRVAH